LNVFACSISAVFFVLLAILEFSSQLSSGKRILKIKTSNSKFLKFLSSGALSGVNADGLLISLANGPSGLSELTPFLRVGETSKSYTQILEFNLIRNETLMGALELNVVPADSPFSPSSLPAGKAFSSSSS
jgi:hypothetical protein